MLYFLASSAVVEFLADGFQGHLRLQLRSIAFAFRHLGSVLPQALQLSSRSEIPRSDALAEVAKSVHYYGGWAIAFLVALHVGAALQHGFIKRDGVLERMLPGRGSGR